MAVMIILFVLLNVSFRTCCIEPVIDSCSVLAVAFSISPMSSLPLFLHCLPSYFATVFSPIPPLSSLSFLLCHFLHCLPPIPPLYILPFHHYLSALSFIVFSAIHQLFFLTFPYGFPPIPPLSSLLCFCVWHQIRTRFAPLSINFPLTNNSWYGPDPVMKNRHGT